MNGIDKTQKRGSGNQPDNVNWTEQRFNIRPHSSGNHGAFSAEPPWDKFKYPEIKNGRQELFQTE